MTIKLQVRLVALNGLIRFFDNATRHHACLVAAFTEGRFDSASGPRISA